MSKNILVLNCGSSSIKFQLFNIENKQLTSKGLVEKIGLADSSAECTSEGKEKTTVKQAINDHKTGIELVLKMITDPKIGSIKSLDEVAAVGHRVAHGGEYFNKSVLVTDDVIEKIKACIPLAPLHNPHNLMGIKVIKEVLGNIPQVCVFDTAFHQTMPNYAYLYGISYDMYKDHAIRRYGFHGTSHLFVSKEGAKLAGLDINNSKIISCHLGNGSSITAIHNGKSIDTSMGLTPLEGVVMGTRCGDLDVGAAINIAKIKNLDFDGLNKYVNKECGLYGVSGVSSDMRDIQKSYEQDSNERAGIALKMLSYKILKYIGSYIAAMNGVDLIIFTGGIGENHALTRENVLKGLSYFGVKYDSDKNKNSRGTFMLSTDDSKIKVAVIKTNEELVIASDTYKLIQK